MTHSPFFKLGARLVLANRDVSQIEFRTLQGMNEKLDAAEGDIFQREVCKIAAAAYEADGLEGSVPCQLFRKLASSDRWCEAYNRFSGPVITALGRFAECEAELSKQAGAVAALPFAADKVGLPGVVKMLLGLGLVGGVGAGSLGFLLSRDARESSSANNEITEKTRAYKQLRRDIDEDLASSGALEDPKPSKNTRYNL